jgi:hypothetical protein
MKAKVLARTKEVRDDGSMVEVVIWELPEAVPPSTHSFKYRLFYGVEGACRARYGNERGKCDHRHLGDKEVDCVFLCRSISFSMTLNATLKTGGRA